MQNEFYWNVFYQLGAGTLTTSITSANTACKNTKEEVTEKRGINKLIGGRTSDGDSSWDTSLFCSRGTTSWH